MHRFELKFKISRCKNEKMHVSHHETFFLCFKIKILIEDQKQELWQGQFQSLDVSDESDTPFPLVSVAVSRFSLLSSLASVGVAGFPIAKRFS